MSHGYPKKDFRFLLIDDHEVVREGVASMLKRDGIAETRIEQAGCAEDALRKINHSDIVICEYSISGTEPLSLIRAMQRRKADVKVIIFSSNQTPQAVRDALNAGVFAYVTKGRELKHLLMAVNEIMTGADKFLEPETTGVRLKGIGRTEIFTKREHDIITYLHEGATNKEISEILSISVRTVETHRKNIMRKSGTRNIGALLHFVNNGKLLAQA